MVAGNKSRGWKCDRKGKYRKLRGIKIARTKVHFVQEERKISLKVKSFLGESLCEIITTPIPAFTPLC